MLTSPCCKWWISPAFYRSNGLDVAIIETLHGRIALKNATFWTLLSSYRMTAVHAVNQLKPPVQEAGNSSYHFFASYSEFGILELSCIDWCQRRRRKVENKQGCFFKNQVSPRQIHIFHRALSK